MEWFGWLNKGVCEVSILDRIIMIVEVLSLILGFYLGSKLYDYVKGDKK